MERKKHLYLIRHAESTHNTYAQLHPEEGDPYHWDAPITPLGETQVAGLRSKVEVTLSFFHPALHVAA